MAQAEKEKADFAAQLDKEINNEGYFTVKREQRSEVHNGFHCGRIRESDHRSTYIRCIYLGITPPIKGGMKEVKQEQPSLLFHRVLTKNKRRLKLCSIVQIQIQLILKQ